MAERYGDGSVRITCEENVIFANVPNDKVQAMLAEPLFKRFKANPGPLLSGMVSCTGNQFCGFGLAETKARAVKVRAGRPGPYEQRRHSTASGTPAQPRALSITAWTAAHNLRAALVSEPCVPAALGDPH